MNAYRKKQVGKMRTLVGRNNDEALLWHRHYTYSTYTPLFARVGTLIVATIYLQLIQNNTCFEVLLSFTVVTSIVYNPLPAMWKS